MVFAMPATASAYNTYVGLKIESVNNPNYNPPTEWVLAVPTTMTINFNDVPITNGTVTTDSGHGSGDTIWSNLVSLNSGSPYTIALVTYTDSTGYLANGYLWWFGAWRESCISVCSSHGGNVYDDCHENDNLNCDILNHFNPLADCGAPVDDLDCSAPYGYHEWTNYPRAESCTPTCTGTGPYYDSHLCACKGSSELNYSFTFTAPAE